MHLGLLAFLGARHAFLLPVFFKCGSPCNIRSASHSVTHRDFPLLIPGRRHVHPVGITGRNKRYSERKDVQISIQSPLYFSFSYYASIFRVTVKPYFDRNCTTLNDKDFDMRRTKVASYPQSEETENLKFGREHCVIEPSTYHSDPKVLHFCGSA